MEAPLERFNHLAFSSTAIGFQIHYCCGFFIGDHMDLEAEKIVGFQCEMLKAMAQNCDLKPRIKMQGITGTDNVFKSIEYRVILTTGQDKHVIIPLRFDISTRFRSEMVTDVNKVNYILYRLLQGNTFIQINTGIYPRICPNCGGLSFVTKLNDKTTIYRECDHCIIKSEGFHDKEETSFIYFLVNRSLNIVKIGISKNIEARKKQLVSMGGSELELYGYFEGQLKDESRMHSYFQDYRKIGEWFTLTPEVERKISEILDGKNRVSTPNLIKASCI